MPGGRSRWHDSTPHEPPCPIRVDASKIPVAPSSNWTNSARIGSASYGPKAGYSGHADWMNGWDEGTFETMLNGCYRPARDCQMNLLGNGQALLPPN